MDQEDVDSLQDIGDGESIGEDGSEGVPLSSSARKKPRHQEQPKRKS